jgi:hypothetical protein
MQISLLKEEFILFFVRNDTLDMSFRVIFEEKNEKSHNLQQPLLREWQSILHPSKVDCFVVPWGTSLAMTVVVGLPVMGGRKARPYNSGLFCHYPIYSGLPLLLCGAIQG